MNRSAVLFSAALATLLIGGPALAQTSGTPKTTEPTGKSSTDKSSQGTAAPAEKPGVLSMPHHVTGSVVSVNAKNHTVAVKDKEGKELTLVADAETAADLGRLK